MLSYRLYLTDLRGRFVDVCETQHLGDTEALVAAEQVLRRAPRVEVWDRARFVGSRRTASPADRNGGRSLIAGWYSELAVQ